MLKESLQWQKHGYGWEGMSKIQRASKGLPEVALKRVNISVQLLNTKKLFNPNFYSFSFQEKRDTFRTLQKYLTSEIGANAPSRPMLDATVRALEAILIKEKDLKEAFVCSMLQHPSFSASLIRLLTSALLRPNLEELPGAVQKLRLLKMDRESY